MSTEVDELVTEEAMQVRTQHVSEFCRAGGKCCGELGRQ